MDVKVEGHPDLVRRGPGVVSIDRTGYEAFVARRRAIQEKEDRMQALEAEVAGLKQGIGEILTLLKGK